MALLTGGLSNLDRGKPCVLKFFAWFAAFRRVLKALVAIKQLLAGGPHELSVTVDATYRLIGKFRYFAH